MHYKALSSVVPKGEQRYAAASYYLNEDPMTKGTGTVTPAPSDKGKTYGHFMIMECFSTKEETQVYCDKVTDRHKVRAVVPVPTCTWIPISTVLRLDQATYTPPGMERSLMKASAVDNTMFVYRPNLRLTADMAQRAGNVPARQVSAAGYTVLSITEEIEEHRKAILEANVRLERAERELQSATLTFADWEESDGSDVRALLPIGVATKLCTLLEASLVAEKAEKRGPTVLLESMADLVREQPVDPPEVEEPAEKRVKIDDDDEFIPVIKTGK